MGVVSGLAVFWMIWWVSIFFVLPWGLRHHRAGEHGTMPGTPVAANMRRVVIINSIIAIVLWLIVYALVESDLISFQRIARHMQ